MIYSTVDPASLAIEVSDRYGMIFSTNDHITVDGIDAIRCQTGGIWASSTAHALVVKNDTLAYNGMSGIYASTDTVTMQNVASHHNGRCRHDHGFYIQGNGCLIDHVTAYDNGGGGISMTGASGTYQYCTVHDNGSIFNWREAQSGYGMELNPDLGETVNCYYNLGYDNYGIGMFLWGSGTLNVYNNVITGTRAFDGWQNIQCDFSHANAVLNFKNNIVGYCGGLLMYFTGTPGTFDIDYNAYINVSAGSNALKWVSTTYDFSEYPLGGWASWKTVTGGETHSFYGDPLWLDYAARNFRIPTGSPCKDTGTNLSLTPDYFGLSVPYNTTTDIGVHEFR
jgi:hypothetical protein